MKIVKFGIATMTNKIKILGLSLAFISQFSFAGAIKDISLTGDCNVEFATLNTVKVSNLDISEPEPNGGPSGNNLLENGPYNASECVGIYSGNDSVQTANNIGELGDGFLNGESSVLTGYEFIDGMVDGALNPWFDGDPMDIDGDTIATDPGWINLAKFDTSTGGTNYNKIESYDGTKSLHISDVLELTFSCSGSDCESINWTLTTDIDIADTVREVLDRSTFDHLAFVAKAGSHKEDQGWAIYDFNFYEIFGNEALNGNGVFDFETAYSLSGSINVKYNKNANDKIGDFSAGLSHLSVWARDPVGDEVTQVPEPSTIALFGLSLLLIATRRKRL